VGTTATTSSLVESSMIVNDEIVVVTLASHCSGDDG